MLENTKLDLFVQHELATFFARTTYCLVRDSHVYILFVQYESARRKDEIKLQSNCENFLCQSNRNFRNGRFSAKVEKDGSRYTDRPFANQIAGKPVRICCQIINIQQYLDCHIKAELTGLDDTGRPVLG